MIGPMPLEILRVPLPVTIHPTPGSLGAVLARQILDGAWLAASAGRPYLLGCPGGRSAKPIYAALGRLAGESGSDLSGLIIAMMDEYMLEGPGGPVLCPADAHYSCRRFAELEIRQVLSGALPAERQVKPGNVWFPDPDEPPAYDARIQAAGGVDLFILASGGSDGHVAFNPPGTPAEAPSAIVRLAETTRRDNLGTFPDFRSLAEVPPYGLTVGLGTIAAQSRAVAMVIHGAHKRGAASRLLASTGFDSSWPATIVHRCRNAQIHLDRAAAALSDDGCGFRVVSARPPQELIRRLRWPD
jgi:glucosamine-6-phosphate deaminase